MLQPLNAWSALASVRSCKSPGDGPDHAASTDATASDAHAHGPHMQAQGLLQQLDACALKLATAPAAIEGLAGHGPNQAVVPQAREALNSALRQALKQAMFEQLLLAAVLGSQREGKAGQTKQQAPRGQVLTKPSATQTAPPPPPPQQQSQQHSRGAHLALVGMGAALRGPLVDLQGARLGDAGAAALAEVLQAQWQEHAKGRSKQAADQAQVPGPQVPGVASLGLHGCDIRGPGALHGAPVWSPCRPLYYHTNLAMLWPC